MKRVTIYVDESDWEKVQKFALELSLDRGKRIGIGKYLMEAHNSFWLDHGENLLGKPPVGHPDSGMGKNPGPIEKAEKTIRKAIAKKPPGWVNPLSDSVLGPKPTGRANNIERGK